MPMTWSMTMRHRQNVWRARMAEFRVRKEAANKCMRLHDEWLLAARGTGDALRGLLEAKAHAARECAASIARCTLDHPYVSPDPQVRSKAWSEPDS